MRIHVLTIIGLASATLLASGCGGGGKRTKTVEVVRPDRGHTCELHCHPHYHDNRGKLIVVKDHRHGPGCGHQWDGRRWVAAKRVETRQRGHACDLDCHGHHFEGGREVRLSRHQHGRDCGHVYNGHRWVKSDR